MPSFRNMSALTTAVDLHTNTRDHQETGLAGQTQVFVRGPHQPASVIGASAWFEIVIKQHSLTEQVEHHYTNDVELHCECRNTARCYVPEQNNAKGAFFNWFSCVFHRTETSFCLSATRNWYKLHIQRGCALVIWMCLELNPFTPGQKSDCLKFYVGTQLYFFGSKL